MLTERQLLILQVIVDDFIRSAQPVGSRSLSKKQEIQLSSATIRNEMADLEERGFIEKTHTSSGRVPSQKGYRFYVDHLLDLEKVEEGAVQKIGSFIKKEQKQMEKLMANTAELLSEMTNYTAIALGPQAFEQTLKKIQVVPISKEVAVMILVTNTGSVHNQAITLPHGIEVNELEKFVNIVNERLVNTSIFNLSSVVEKEMTTLLNSHVDFYQELIQILTKLPSAFDEKGLIRVSGKTRMLHQPEFTNLKKIRELLEIMEGEAELTQILRPEKAGLSISIGRENKIATLDDCTLITTTYEVDEGNYGTIAILGPTRMEYSKVIPLVNYFSYVLSRVLQSKED